MRFAAACVLSAALLAGTATASTRSAHVALTSASPVSVRGTGFKANERVQVTFAAQATRTKTVTANALGRFRTTFRGVSLERCEAWVLRAKGNLGSTAVAKVVPECAPELPGDPGFPIDPNPKKP